MLSGGFMESKGGDINLPEIKSAVLEQVIRYMYYKVTHHPRSGWRPLTSYTCPKRWKQSNPYRSDSAEATSLHQSLTSSRR